MSDYKDKILDALSRLEVTPESIAEQLAQVIRGESVSEKYKGEQLVSRTVKRDPQDMMRGAMLYDALHGGQLGIAPKTTDFRRPAEIVHKRMSVDNRIIVSPVEDYLDEE